MSVGAPVLASQLCYGKVAPPGSPFPSEKHTTRDDCVREPFRPFFAAVPIGTGARNEISEPLKKWS
ncbi:hypothetical protein KDH_14240 [Dictyobacter sp. S3.2.2.5]|uniref:Uncharacterized protein n=1 Tax=Dictyobacter halimunensis TaxID=3026934 RepID=A0ABQ6FMS7_9CHLR|nr:hypothetical protein KDH_14240 [Dictyobacter sp. S3.2.2.5]